MSSGTLAPAAPPQTDARLIADSLHDPEAFRVVFDRHYARVRRYAASRVGDAADDIAAETFATAFDLRHRYDTTRSDAGPWLFGIATNLIRRQRRSERARLRALASLVADPTTGAPVEPTVPGTEVAAALMRLDRRDRDVLALFALAELSYVEIAEALGIPPGTVRSRLNRARRVIKEALRHDR